MLFWTIVKVGLKSLLANKVRSFLAMLGIIIGVGSVIALLAVGTGAKQSVLKRFTAMGTNLLIIRPQQTSSGGVASNVSQKLTLDDAVAELSTAAGIARLSPVVGNKAQVKYLNHNSRTSINGVATTYLTVRAFEIDRGRSFTDVEVDTMARVAILGPVTAAALFPDTDPIGQVVKINGINFRVIGLLKSKGDTGFYNMDDQVLVPYTIAMKQLFGQAVSGTPNVISEIDVQAEDNADLTKVQDGISAVLRKRHRLPTDGSADDFMVRNQADIIQQQTDTSDTLTYLLGGAAVISLLVGGIGIMNIMLVTVTERTREIGVRKAIGAKENSLLLQFLLESVIVCGVGGALGILLGFLGVWGLAQSPKFSPVVEWWTVLAAFAVSGIVGVFFGFYPAWRAARLDPIEALRYE